jgi:hypothetical protein
MTVFQQIALGVVGGLAAVSLNSAWRGRTNRLATLAWLGLWAAAALALTWPELTQRAARALGIQRGSDLVFYCAVLAMLGGFLIVSLRLRRQSRELTLLVRHLALQDAAPAAAGEAEPPDPDPDGDPWDEEMR